MALNYSQFISRFREYLSKDDDVSIPRYVLILAGDEAWHVEAVTEMLHGHEKRALWIGKHGADEEKTPELIPNTTVKKAHHWLGGEKQVVIFNASEKFDPDAFAAISGIVIGGGVFVLLLAAEECWDDVYSSHFGQRLLQSIHDTAELTVIKQHDEEINFCPQQSQKKSSVDCCHPFLTLDQQQAVESIEEQVHNDSNNPIVLISDRGRGKSAALGISAARLIQAGIKNIVITAPRLRASGIIFKHIAELLPGAVSTRGKVEYGESVIQFYSPDQLIEEHINADVLLVDEAAAIPVPLLTSFLHNYSQCVFSTTVHGYEGTGRGFVLRFYKVLNNKNSAWLKLKMETPIRWPLNDPLEKWMFSLLCLDAEIVDIKSTDNIELNHAEQYLITKEKLVSNQALLNEVFALLVLAHYRTRPNDLKNLLDDEGLSLYVSLHKNHVLAVALVIREGSFSGSLSTSVYRGERRPQGNLLAQALTYHCGVEHAATLDYARVMRIAVHPDLQHKGMGTALLDFIISSEKQHGRDAIGTSFGMNKALLHFWDKSKFNVVRIGFTREQTSGEHAAIMLLGLSEKGIKLKNEVCTRFKEQLPFWFQDVLKDIPLEIKKIFHHEINKALALTQLDKKDLQSFIQYSRNYELCIAALNKLVMIKHDEILMDSFPDDFRQVLNSKVINKISWKAIREEMSLSGQNEARKLFHKAIVYLTD